MSVRSDRFWLRFALQLAAELTARDLLAADVISTDAVYKLLSRANSEDTRHGFLQIDPTGICGPPPELLFQVVCSKFYLFDDVLAWAAPMLDRRGRARLRVEDQIVRQAERHARRAAAIPRSTPGGSGFHGVVYQAAIGQWLALRVPRVGGGRYNRADLLRHWPTAEEAARVVDRVRIADGYPPVNFPDEADAIAEMPDPRESFRPVLARRDFADTVDALFRLNGETTVEDVAQELRRRHGWAPTVHSIRGGLRRAVEQGKAVQTGRGVYAPTLQPERGAHRC